MLKFKEDCFRIDPDFLGDAKILPNPQGILSNDWIPFSYIKSFENKGDSIIFFTKNNYQLIIAYEYYEDCQDDFEMLKDTFSEMGINIKIEGVITHDRKITIEEKKKVSWSVEKSCVFVGGEEIRFNEIKKIHIFLKSDELIINSGRYSFGSESERDKFLDELEKAFNENMGKKVLMIQGKIYVIINGMIILPQHITVVKVKDTIVEIYMKNFDDPPSMIVKMDSWENAVIMRSLIETYMKI